MKQVAIINTHFILTAVRTSNPNHKYWFSLSLNLIFHLYFGIIYTFHVIQGIYRRGYG
jgi:hypothetical protein